MTIFLTRAHLQWVHNPSSPSGCPQISTFLLHPKLHWESQLPLEWSLLQCYKPSASAAFPHGTQSARRNLLTKKRNSFGKAIKLYASGFQPSFIWGAERLNSSSRGQKMRPRNREHRFSIPSFKVFVTDHGQQHRHRNNSTSMAVLKLLHSQCQRARTKKTANINPVLALSSILSLDLAMNTPWDYSDLKPTLSMSGQSCLIRVTYQESMFHFLSMLRLGNMLYHMHLESLQQYVSKDR